VEAALLRRRCGDVGETVTLAADLQNVGNDALLPGGHKATSIDARPRTSPPGLHIGEWRPDQQFLNQHHYLSATFTDTNASPLNNPNTFRALTPRTFRARNEQLEVRRQLIDVCRFSTAWAGTFGLALASSQTR
jgi:hypothetical protein